MSTPRILIIRTSAFGDIVHALPVLTALRRHYSAATIGWVIEDAFAPLLDDHQLVDEIIRVRLRSWRNRLHTRSTWQEIASFFHQLHEFSAEIVVDLMGNHKAGAIGALSFADRRIGHVRADRRERSSALWISESVAARGAHAVDRMLSTLDRLGIEETSPDFAGHLLAEQPVAGVEDSRPYVLLHPFTGWANKDYPLGAWASVANRLAASGVAVLVAPGPGEEGRAREILRLAPEACEMLQPTSLPKLVFLQRRASLVLGGDTGPVHLAHALGTPVLCVMGPTDPIRHGPYGAQEKAIAHALPCSFCHKRLDGPRACLLEIEPELVADRALQTLYDASH